jgi:cobalt-zinc-cadmium efflux system protein
MHVWALDNRQLMATLHARLKLGADAEQSIQAIKERPGVAHGINHATVEIETGQACPDDLLVQSGTRRMNGKARG